MTRTKLAGALLLTIVVFSNPTAPDAVPSDAESSPEQPVLLAAQDEGPPALASETMKPCVEMPVGPFNVSGRLEFHAEFKKKHRVGLVPHGLSPLPYLRVCLWARNGADIDFQTMDYPDAPAHRLVADDDLLGCDIADENGNYSISFEERSGPDVYLTTRLCNDQDRDLGGRPAAAEVCVRVNADEGNAASPENVKTIWSRVYPAIQARCTSISWNLSCPDKSGLGLTSVECLDSELEPDDWEDAGGVNCSVGDPSWKKGNPAAVDCSSEPCADTNSRFGCNKEAVHVYRAAIQPYVAWGSQKPTKSNTFPKTCPEATNAEYCDIPSCQDEIMVRLKQVTLAGSWPEDDSTPCNGEPDNGAGRYDKVGIGSPEQPMRITHEIGHIIQHRWSCDGRGYSGGQRTALMQGWADFAGAAAWWSETATAPQYCAGVGCSDIEHADEEDGARRRVSRFFWDLVDADSTLETETVDRGFKRVRKIWSAFPNTTDPGGTQEGYSKYDGSPIDIDANNLWDYAYWYDQKVGDDICPILFADPSEGGNGLTGLQDSLASGGIEDICSQ